jgi:uncharacterized protein DUF4160
MKLVPTVLRFDGLRVMIYPNDHRPSHVHVIRSDGEAVFSLGCPNGPVELRENYGFRSGQISRMEAALTEYLEGLCQAWEEIHGIA